MFDAFGSSCASAVSVAADWELLKVLSIIVLAVSLATYIRNKIKGRNLPEGARLRYFVYLPNTQTSEDSGFLKSHLNQIFPGFFFYHDFFPLTCILNSIYF